MAEKQRLMQELEKLRNLDPNIDEDGEIGYDGYEESTNQIPVSEDEIITDEIKDIGKLIVMRLKAQRHTKNDMMEYLYGHGSLDKNSVTLELIRLNLKQVPFLLNDIDSNKLIYAIKNLSRIRNESDEVDIQVINHGWLKIIGGEYNSYRTAEEERELELQIHKKVFKDRETDIRKTFEKNLGNKGEKAATIEEIEKNLNQCGCQIIKSHQEYIHLALFRECDNMYKLPYENMFVIFSRDFKEGLGDTYIDEIRDGMFLEDSM